MKRRLGIHFFACIVLILALCVGLLSCSAPKDYVTDSDYKIISKDGKYYIVFDDISVYEISIPEDINISMLGTVQFESMKDYKETVTKGKLTEDQKVTIVSAFTKDENGILCCDFHHLYVPTMPTGGIVDGLSWSGSTYSFSVKPDENIFGYVHYDTKSDYDRAYLSEYETFFDRDLVTVTETEQLDGDKVATYYSTSSGEFMRLRYSLSDGDKKIVVDKAYRLKMCDTSIPTSSTVPYQVDLYCVENDTYCVVQLFGFVENPTDSWLLEFGLAEYDGK